MDERDFKNHAVTFVVAKCRKCGSRIQYDANEIHCSLYGFFFLPCSHCGVSDVHHVTSVDYLVDTVLNEEGV